MKDIEVIALGGSIIVSDKINTGFLGDFREFILKFLKDGKKFILVTGGGKIARDYQNAASEIIDLSDEDKDWLGIHATRLNGHLLRAIFFDIAHPVVLDDPTKKIDNEDNYNLFIASGWRPGWSTDYVAALLTKRFGAKRLIIATKISHVYDDDIEKNINAKPLENISWADYINMVGSAWIPGMKSPVDPIAAKFCEENGIEAIVAKGTELRNLEKVLRGEEFIGTTIR
jgi:uridylate kinase